jgi:hypothetical protein
MSEAVTKWKTNAFCRHRVSPSAASCQWPNHLTDLHQIRPITSLQKAIWKLSVLQKSALRMSDFSYGSKLNCETAFTIEPWKITVFWE